MIEQINRFFRNNLCVRAVLLGGLLLPFISGPKIVLRAEGSDPLQRVVATMRSIGTFKANIGIQTSGDKLNGDLSYDRGRFHLKLSDGRVIASNGNNLIVYSPASNVAGKQEIKPGTGGLGWILNGYKARVTGNQAQLKAERETMRFSELKLKWGEDYVLREIQMFRKTGDTPLVITLSNFRRVESFPASLFSFSTPAGSRTVENPLNQSN